jgi:hypothetical protein
MPDTPGKRQRREVKAKRRQAKDQLRAARKERREDPSIVAPWMDPSYGQDVDDVDSAPPADAEDEQAGANDRQQS